MYAREQMVVSLHTEQNIPVVRASLRMPQSYWFLEPKTLAEDIHVAHVLLPDNDSCAAVCLANLISRLYTLAAGVKSGQASIAQVVDVLQEPVSDH